jgi:membrane protease YdiL (CAAX protease family)
MRPARALLGFLIFVFLGAALVAPWVYHGLNAIGFSGIPFRRVVDRCLLVLALGALWPFVRRLGVRSASELGLKIYPRLGRDLAIGVLIGTTLLFIAMGLSLAVGASVWHGARSGLPKQIAAALLTAFIVAVLEEILFRGAIYTALARVAGATFGLFVSGALYAILHFFARPQNPDAVTWNSGFIVLGRMLNGFTDFHQVIPGFFSLTLLGIILTLAFRRTGALFMSMGIHAAVVFWVKLYGFAVDSNAAANTWFWGTGKLIDGWFCFILLVVVTGVFAKQKPRPA